MFKVIGATFAGFGGLLVILALICIGPILLIWGVNTLFSMSIEFSFWNILAGLAIMVALRGGSR